MIRCPICWHLRSAVMEARHGRRRRQCSQCGHRWTTYEVEALELERLRGIEKRAKELAETLEL